MLLKIVVSSMVSIFFIYLEIFLVHLQGIVENVNIFEVE